MYKDGWWLAMKTERIPWVLTPGGARSRTRRASGTRTPDPAELYYLPDDFTQAHDLAAEHPEKVQELKELFWEEAERYKVLPLLATLSTFFGILPPIAGGDDVRVPRRRPERACPGMIPRIYNRSYSITADLVVPEGGAEGVIVAEADHLGGFTLYVKDGKLTHTYSMMGVFVFKQVAEEDLPTGEVTVRMEFAADEAKPATGGEVTLFIDDRPVGKGRMDHTVPIRFSGYAGMDIGRDNGGVVDLSYEDRKPFAFTGTVKKVVFDIKPHLSDQDELDLHAAAHRGQRRRTAWPADRTRREPMWLEDETTDVLIGGYLSADAAHEDYEAVLDCGAHLSRAPSWSARTSRATSRSSRPTTWSRRAPQGSAAVGLRGRPVRAAAARRDRDRCRDRRRRRARSLHKKTGSKIEEAAGETIPIGGAGLIVAYQRDRRGEGRAGGDPRDQEGGRRGRGPPRRGAQGRPRRRAAEDGRRGRLRQGGIMGMTEMDELGPVDYLVVEFPAGQSNFDGGMAKELAALVQGGQIRVLDLLVLHKDDDGSIEAFEIDDLDEVDELRALETEIAEILAEDDVVHLAASMENGSTAGVLVWENTWAAPFASAARRAGGQLIASGRIPIQAIAASMEAEMSEEGA